jgi:hypothetical protein
MTARFNEAEARTPRSAFVPRSVIARVGARLQ